MEIIGHRGAAGVELENTIESIKAAIEIGVKYIEIDVRETFDNQLVVFHDPYLERVSHEKGFIKEVTYEKLQKIRLHNGSSIPLLAEILPLIKNKNIKLIVEAKTDTSVLLAKALLLKKLDYTQFIIGSFFHENIRKIKEENPRIQTAIMLEGVPVLFSDYLQKVNPDFVVTSIETLNDSLEKVTKNQKRKLIFYTVNTEVEMQIAAKMKPFGIITNYPNLFIQKEN
ncbi:glycerophosphoryl diester phosphodiesterase [Kordia sp. SMS9]|uniref:glycerophosphodiester phosphodiesterase n=1 Tax=Kordia sp. SMS9 TaxID=2282170 RepID=UPI000E0D7A76|nr:glycerophosphodiester phosphodiesterase family protein [Kordia sp. SMS9]AXG71474.1 glycerophosphoryl diester phosphodiesterase [Kordia sp. SMS9]